MDELQDQLQGFAADGVDYISKLFHEILVLALVRTHLQLQNTKLRLEKMVAARIAELEALLLERS